MAHFTFEKKLELLSREIIDCTRNAATMLVHREAIALKGKFKGRRGRITGVICNPKDGLVACLMIYKHRSTEFLNSHGDTRTYWPLKFIKLV